MFCERRRTFGALVESDVSTFLVERPVTDQVVLRLRRLQNRVTCGSVYELVTEF